MAKTKQNVKTPAEKAWVTRKAKTPGQKAAAKAWKTRRANAGKQ